MIQEFYVENYQSIKGRQGISFVPNRKMSTGSEEYLLIRVSEHVQLLKLGILYGYNASGKSNLLEAMDFLRTLVVDGAEAKDEKTGFEPFLLSPETLEVPGSFQLVFYIDAVKYEYSVSLNGQRILSESLYFTPDVRKARLYTRVYDEDLRVSRLSFGTSCGFKSRDRLLLEGNTLENCTVLSAYRKTNVNSLELDKVFSYFRDHISPIITPRVLLREWSVDRLIQDDRHKDFLLRLLVKADFQISGLDIIEDSFDVTAELLDDLKGKGAPAVLLEDLKQKKTVENRELVFSHTTTQGEYNLPFEKESQGTLRYFGLGGILNEMITSRKFIFIDEIETSLHPDLVSFFMQQFLMNTTGSQLFVTTHNQFLMEQDYIRNDMLWLCEKDEEGQSTYYSVQDFRLHKNVSVMNHYRAGKLGASPQLGSPVLGEGY